MGTGTEIRVLHVDDEAEFADLTSSFLKQEDSRITVETATSANEGLDRLGQDGYDCIVSDYNMPGQTGVQFLDAVRKEHPDLPFILFTGKGSEEIASEAISAGVTDYLQKGSKAEQYELLANRIQNAVDACRTKQLVRERTRRLETLIGNLPGMVYRCKNKQQWPMETVEGEVERLTGYSSDTLEGNEVLWGEEIIHPEDRETMWEAVQDGLSERGVFEVTYRIITKGGTTKWMWERVGASTLRMGS
ncbi:response regulator [Halovenus salina]|uniref:Response regulator n=1 Tax=Halovenus salina TaxID=1510225 RepID=A0ABD5W342_9EURY